MLDEIQALNKKQQQALLEVIEEGSVTLIASTADNPYFVVYKAILSRSTIFEFKPIQKQDIYLGLKRAVNRLKPMYTYENINVELMNALPGQTKEELKESVKEIIELKPEHISVYSLILEEGTVLYKIVKYKKMELARDEVERDIYWYVKIKLEKHKYYQYEISNFAKKGYESKHNMNCWNQMEYVGLFL